MWTVDEIMIEIHVFFAFWKTYILADGSTDNSVTVNLLPR